MQVAAATVRQRSSPRQPQLAFASARTTNVCSTVVGINNIYGRCQYNSVDDVCPHLQRCARLTHLLQSAPAPADGRECSQYWYDERLPDGTNCQQYNSEDELGRLLRQLQRQCGQAGHRLCLSKATSGRAKCAVSPTGVEAAASLAEANPSRREQRR